MIVVVVIRATFVELVAVFSSRALLLRVVVRVRVEKLEDVVEGVASIIDDTLGDDVRGSMKLAVALVLVAEVTVVTFVVEDDVVVFFTVVVVVVPNKAANAAAVPNTSVNPCSDGGPTQTVCPHLFLRPLDSAPQVAMLPLGLNAAKPWSLP